MYIRIWFNHTHTLRAKSRNEKNLNNVWLDPKNIFPNFDFVGKEKRLVSYDPKVNSGSSGVWSGFLGRPKLWG